MKVRDLIALLAKVTNQDAEINLNLNITATDSEAFDIPSEITLMGLDLHIDESLETLDIIVTPVDKRRNGGEFETLIDLITDHKNVKVEFTEYGMYFYADGELRREIEFAEDMDFEPLPELIKRLVFEL